jgi:hypothetical protein
MSLWAQRWKLNFKASKSNELIFRSRRLANKNYPNLDMNGEAMPRVKSHKHLGVILDKSLTYENYINNTIEKCNHLLNPLKALTSSVQSKHLERIYQLFILPHLDTPLLSKSPDRLHTMTQPGHISTCTTKTASQPRPATDNETTWTHLYFHHENSVTAQTGYNDTT